MLAGSAGQHVVGFWDSNIDIFPEVQDKKYSYILYLIGYIAYGLHFWYDSTIRIANLACWSNIITPPAYDKKFPLLAEGLKFLNFWGRLRPSDQFLNTLSGPRIFALKRYPKDRGMG